VSVVIPVYDGEAYVAEAIDSVLAQTHTPIEVICIDDGSRDRSAEILAGYRNIRTIRQANTGCTGARNAGIAAARGDYVAFIDQDDKWRPNRLEVQMAALAAHPDAGYALGMINLFLEPGCPTPSWMGTRGWTIGTSRVGYMPGTMLVRRRIFDQLGVFDDRYQVGSDADWLIRAKDAKVPVTVVPEVVLDKRIHRSNLSGSPAGSSDMLGVIAESLRRRRAATP
jgi:glycosyltransferase involved in cell wall biosynthesis